MKKTWLILCVLLIILLLYCIGESVVLNSFAENVRIRLQPLQEAGDAQTAKGAFVRLEEYIASSKWWLEQIAPRTEQEQLALSLGQLKAYLTAEKLSEVRVSCEEISCIVADICDPPII